MPDLFEFASQVATPEYVAAKIAEIEMDVTNSHDSAVIAAVVLAASFAVTLAATIVYGKKDSVSGSSVLAVIAGVGFALALAALLALVANLANWMSLTVDLARWSCDPVTEVAAKLAASI